MCLSGLLQGNYEPQSLQWDASLLYDHSMAMTSHCHCLIADGFCHHPLHHTGGLPAWWDSFKFRGICLAPRTSSRLSPDNSKGGAFSIRISVKMMFQVKI